MTLEDLKKRREQKGLTQKDLANKLKLGTQSISNIERGVSPIPAKHMKPWSKIIGVTYDEMMDHNVYRYTALMKRRMKSGN